MRLPAAAGIFRELVSAPTAPFYEAAAARAAVRWARRELGGKVAVRAMRGGVVLSYRGAGKGPALALAAHLDHPAFHLEGVTARGAKARLMGGLLAHVVDGAKVEAFPPRPAGNAPMARGTLGKRDGDLFELPWSAPPPRGARPAFAVLALPAFEVQGRWLASRSIDDLLGCAASLETLRRVVRAGVKTNLTVLLNRAEEVGFIGAMDLAASGAVGAGDSVVSVETSKALSGNRPGRGATIRVGDRMTLFDPNLLALLDDAAARLKARGVKVQRARLTGGACEATAYAALGFESAGAAIPLVNYHNAGRDRAEPEKVRLDDLDGVVRLLVETARLYPTKTLRGVLRARLDERLALRRPLLERLPL